MNIGFIDDIFPRQDIFINIAHFYLLSEPKDTIEDVYEPYLIQEGFLQKTPRGRVATPKALTHLGVPAPAPRAQLNLPVE